MSLQKMENTHQMIPRDAINVIAPEGSITKITYQSRNILNVQYAEPPNHYGVKVTFKPNHYLKMIDGQPANPIAGAVIAAPNQLGSPIGVEFAADGSAIWISTGSSLQGFSLTIWDPINTDCGSFPIP